MEMFDRGIQLRMGVRKWACAAAKWGQRARVKREFAG